MDPNQPKPNIPTAPSASNTLPPIATPQSQTPITFQTVPSPAPSSHSFNKMFLIILIVLLILVGLGFGGLYYYQNDFDLNEHNAKVETLNASSDSNQQGTPIQMDKLTLSVPWIDFQNSQDMTTGAKRFIFANNKVITVIELPPSMLLTKADLTLPNDQFENKYKLTANVDVELQSYILNNTIPQKPQTVPDFIDFAIPGKRTKLKALRQTTFVIPDMNYSIVNLDNLTIIKGLSSTATSISVQDSSGNLYSIFIKADNLKGEDLNTIIESIKFSQSSQSIQPSTATDSADLNSVDYSNYLAYQSPCISFKYPKDWNKIADNINNNHAQSKGLDSFGTTTVTLTKPTYSLQVSCQPNYDNATNDAYFDQIDSTFKQDHLSPSQYKLLRDSVGGISTVRVMQNDAAGNNGIEDVIGFNNKYSLHFHLKWVTGNETIANEFENIIKSVQIKDIFNN